MLNTIVIILALAALIWPRIYNYVLSTTWYDYKKPSPPLFPLVIVRIGSAVLQTVII